MNSYDVGTYIDLSYLNRRIATPIQKKSIPAATKAAYDSGTQIIFKTTGETLQAFRRIPVTFAV